MVHPPPHGGTTVKMGPTAQLEFVLDPSSGLLTAYVLDGMGMATQRTTAKTIELQVTPPGGQATGLSLNSTANGLTGDTVGNSSQFGGTLPALKGTTAFTGVVKSFTVGGQTVRTRVQLPERGRVQDREPEPEVTRSAPARPGLPVPRHNLGPVAPSKPQ